MKLAFWRPDRSLRPAQGTGLWDRYGADAMALAEAVDVDLNELPAIAAKAPRFALSPGRGACNWYLQDVGPVAVGGVMTAFRIADQLKSSKGLHQRFLICGRADLAAIADRVLAAFPGLKGSEFIALDSAEKLAAIPPADIGVATLWTTAYVLARVTNCARKMYLIQDFEPLFYPAGSTSAQAELTYRFGFEAICNTEPLRVLYQERYDGEAVAFTPQVDHQVFHPDPTERRRRPVQGRHRLGRAGPGPRQRQPHRLPPRRAWLERGTGGGGRLHDPSRRNHRDPHKRVQAGGLQAAFGCSHRLKRL